MTLDVEAWAPADALDRRLSRSRLHAFVRRTSHRAGAGDCMITPTGGSVRVNVDRATGRGHVSGVKRCASPWACPVCAPTIRQRRARELTELVDRAQSEGHVCVLVTYTLPHHAGEPLDQLMQELAASWKAIWSGRAAVAFREMWGVVGQVRSIEITYGENGWHPHVHQVIFLDRRFADVGALLTNLWIALHQRWTESVLRACGRRPNTRNGVDVELVHDAQAVGDYVTDAGGWSIGAELALHPVKVPRASSSVSPFGLLGAAAMWGDAKAARLWWEYERATAGRHAIQASPGLYARYEVESADDEDAAAPAVDDVLVTVEVDPMSWVLLVEYHQLDRYVLAIETWAAAGATGPPPDPHDQIRKALAARSPGGTS